MTKKAGVKPDSFSLALAEHDPEGIDILLAEPSRLISSSVYLVFAILMVCIIWVFSGKMDITVSATGVISPDRPIQRIYSPLHGEIIEFNFSEGMPISENELIARIHAPKAVQMNQAYRAARLSLARKERDLEIFQTRKALLEEKAETLQQHVLTEKSRIDQAKAPSVQNNLALVNARIAYEQQLEAIYREEAELQDAVVAAKLEKEVLEKTASGKIDDQGHVQIHSPAAGVITNISFNQRGDHVTPGTLLAEIIPESADARLTFEFPESDRALLQVGQQARITIKAYGTARSDIITGKIDTIAPVARKSINGQPAYYQGQIRLDRHYPLQFGMTASVLVQTGQKRIIDYLLGQ